MEWIDSCIDYKISIYGLAPGVKTLFVIAMGTEP